MVDELLLNQIEDTEKIKNLSTANDYKVEAKGKDRREIEFFAKSVLCPTTSAIQSSSHRKRYVSECAGSYRFRNLQAKMEGKIPHFLHFLLDHKLSTRQELRMWFAPTSLETPALHKIKKYDTTKIEAEIAVYCVEVMDRHGENRVSYYPNDIIDTVRDAGLKADLTQIRSIFKDSWGLRSDKNREYTFYHIGTEDDLFPMKKRVLLQGIAGVGRKTVVVCDFY